MYKIFSFNSNNGRFVIDVEKFEEERKYFKQLFRERKGEFKIVDDGVWLFCDKGEYFAKWVGQEFIDECYKWGDEDEPYV